MLQIPSATVDALSYYVYALRNPLTGDVFYVGSGEGQRVYAHANLALAGHPDPDAELNPQLAQVRSLTADGIHVEHLFVHTGISNRATAEVVALAVNEALGLAGDDGPGRGSSIVDRMVTVESRIDEIQARPPQGLPMGSVIFLINRSWEPGASAADVYEATRGHWRISEADRDATRHVFGVAGGVIRGAYYVENWHQSVKHPGRWEFRGGPATELDMYVGMDVRHLLHDAGRGSGNPVRLFLSPSTPELESHRPTAGMAVVSPMSPWWDEPPAAKYAGRVRGCLLGGAIGDALGAPLEFQTLDEMWADDPDRDYVRRFRQYNDGTSRGYGLVTDDTQMTLFTVEGLIRSSVRLDHGLGFTVGCLDHAYRRWLDTQQHAKPTGRRDGWLQAEQWLYARRAPGNTCMAALTHAPEHFGEPVHNESKGCGAVMRSAPIGLINISGAPRTYVFDVAVEAASFTHGHPTGQIAAGAFALLIGYIADGHNLTPALQLVMDHLRTVPGHEETLTALEQSLEAAHDLEAGSSGVEHLGAGWVAEEALAIAVFAALVHPGADEFTEALALAVTHSGDSDSTGSICGNILGTLHGDAGLPPELAFEVEGRGTILQLADDFVYEFTAGPHLHGDHGPFTRWTDRYPGW